MDIPRDRKFAVFEEFKTSEWDPIQYFAFSLLRVEAHFKCLYQPTNVCFCFLLYAQHVINFATKLFFMLRRQRAHLPFLTKCK